MERMDWMEWKVDGRMEWNDWKWNGMEWNGLVFLFSAVDVVNLSPKLNGEYNHKVARMGFVNKMDRQALI